MKRSQILLLAVLLLGLPVLGMVRLFAASGDDPTVLVASEEVRRQDVVHLEPGFFVVWDASRPRAYPADLPGGVDLFYCRRSELFQSSSDEVYRRDGVAIAGTATRTLDRYPVDFLGDSITVDPRILIEGQPQDQPTAPAPEGLCDPPGPSDPPGFGSAPEND